MSENWMDKVEVNNIDCELLKDKPIFEIHEERESRQEQAEFEWNQTRD